MSILVGILMTIHGLITFAIGGAAVSGAPPVAGAGNLPGAGWYPIALGESWLLRGSAAQLGGALWLIAGIGLLATAAAMFGIVLPTGMWRVLALASSLSALAALVLYFHPYYVIAIVVNLAILAAATTMEETSRRLLGV